jgi:D-beta-D-heptose 7-phosphate kinase/D-beta-D-heptose 1-phosphate adenosyltransferase
MSLGPRRARTLLRSMSGRRVLVLGDVMLDQFLWGTVSRISPEAPVPVVQVTSQSFHLGGAANVATNVRSLGGEAVVVGVVGHDAEAEHVRAALAKAGIGDGLATDTRRPTTLKTRIVAHHQQVVRADRELAEEIPPGVEDALVARLKDALRGCGAVVLSDYQKGVVTARVMKALTSAARRARVPVLVDPKVRRFGLYRGVSLVTPNQLEAEQATGVRIRSDEDLGAAGAKILRLLRCGAALITRGEHGMTLFERDKKPVHLPTAAREVFDVTGAGDTVIATLGLAQAAGAPLVDAARLANHAAGVVVGKLGTAVATPDEILAALEP